MVYKIKISCNHNDMGFKKPDKDPASVRWPQYLAAIIGTIGGLCSGNHLGWTSPTLPSITKPNGNATSLLSSAHTQAAEHGQQLVTTAEAAWIASMLPLGATLGSLLVALFLVESLGRKGCILAMGALFTVSWLLIGLAQLTKYPAIMMYVGRFVGGLAAGGLTIVVPIYSEEVTVKEVRGRVGVFFDLSVNAGIVLSYVAGGLAPQPHPWLAWMCAALPLLHVALLCRMPESPVFLLRRGRDEAALSSLRWLRYGHKEGDYDVSEEFDSLKAAICAEKKEIEQPPIYTITTQTSVLDCELTEDLKKRVRWISAGIILGLMFFRPLSGINTVTFYSAPIFQEAGSPLSPNNSSMIIGAVLLTSNTTASRLVDHVGRRALLLVSLGGIVISYTLLVAYFYLKTVYPDIELTASWVPLLSLILFVVSFSLGMGPLPWLIMAELLPVENKKGSALYVSLTWLLSFLITNFFSDAVDTVGSIPTYLFFLVANVLAIAFVVPFVPETKGKSRETITREIARIKN
ncbi:facilitated trehalose transporter Tret1-like [Schistocerca piceifrons]|uniref:facilitated trehalose transporter Tret1-like n=1 Tax=Schistocerca piceifrons TaxID=274613 RepID=UPI001F5EF19C|nr:facilitated trehalose transporter Tret1-like [Schistocerca piceifrons]XP_047103142.1 facilitated trehalose transporter Tret1-like [Schistocerca piceifrons]